MEQVTFLQHNPVYSGVCSDVLIFNESTNSFKAQSLYLDTKQVQDFDFDLVLHDTMVHLPTLLFRKELIDVSLFRTNHLFADLSTTLMLLDKGPIQFWKRPDVVYRLHSGGITRTTKYCKFYEQIIEFLDDLNEHTNFRHNESIEERKQLLKAMIKIGGESRNPFKKLSGMYSYLRHDRKSVTSKEIKSIIGLAFPRVISRFRRSG
jgi:hypothetical protein